VQGNDDAKTIKRKAMAPNPLLSAGTADPRLHRCHNECNDDIQSPCCKALGLKFLLLGVGVPDKKCQQKLQRKEED